MKTIILLNGPPRSGKTEIANHLAKIHDYHYVNFSDTIRQVQSILFPLSEYEHWKRTELYNKYTGRDWMIDFAEMFIKPKLGSDFFAKNLMDRLTAYYMSHGMTNTVIGDLGFDMEYKTVKEKVNKLSSIFSEPVSVQLWHIVRDGCDFAKDSRKYVDKPTRIIYNDGTLSELKFNVNKETKS